MFSNVFSKEEVEKKLIAQFRRTYPQFKEEDIMFSFCPYRVCPVGAHIDHQKGNVTGFAINYGITMAYVKSKTHFFEATSVNFEGTKGANVTDIIEKRNDWADYLRGCAKILHEKYNISNGIYCIIDGSLPIGGVSSSHALSIAFMKALSAANEIHIDKKEAIKLAQEVENKFVGVNSGTLDQSCELLSKKNHLLYLDTSTGSHKLIPINSNAKPFKIAIVFSGVRRTLVGSSYNTRVDELKSASYALKAYKGMEYGSYSESVLRDVDKRVFLEFKDMLPEPWRRRATHYYTEMDRVERAVSAWKKGDIEEFGKISFESGESSIHNYEAGSPELVAIHDIMHHTDGIYGGRFSGAGFKGCCLAIVDPAYEDFIRAKLTKEYIKVFPQYKDSFRVFFCDTSDGCDL